MADISYPQIVHDIKEKYIEATGEPDNIKFGEIAQDIYDAITSGGGGSADGSLSNPFVLRTNYNVSMEVTV